MKHFQYSIFIFALSCASSFTMNPVVNLDDQNLSDYPKQEYATKKSGIMRILNRCKKRTAELKHLLNRLQMLYDNRDIYKNEYENKKQVIINKIIAMKNTTRNQLAQVLGHAIDINQLENIENADNNQLEQLTTRLLG